MMTAWRKATLQGAAAVVAGLITQSCGGEEAPAVVRGGGGPADAPGAAKPVVAEVPQFVVNESWGKIKVFFQGHDNDTAGGFIRNGVQTMRDPFEPQIHHYVQKPAPTDPYEKDPASPAAVAEGEDPPEDGGPEAPPVKPLGPLERYRVQDYRLLMIRWGTSVNRAVVQDPTGESFIVAKDMVIGNRKGRIIDIGEYEVVIQEDNSSDHIKLSMQPELLKNQPEKQSDRLYPNLGGAR